MKLSDSIEEMGYFWSPKGPESLENKVQGILRISDTGETFLELQDQRDSDNNIFDFYNKCIFGSIQGGFVALHGCHTFLPGAATNRLFSVKRLNLSAYLALTEFYSDYFLQEENPKFSSVEFSVSNLDEWVGINGFQVHDDFNKHEISVTYRLPEEILLCSIDQLEIKLGFSYCPPSAFFVNERKISQKVYVILSVKEPQSFGYFEDLIFKLSNFFTLAMDYRCFVDNMRGVSPNKCSRCNIYHPGRFRIEDESEIVHIHDMLFTFKDIEDQIDKVLSKWLEGHKNYNEAFCDYFSSAYSKRRNAVAVFLDFVRCVKVLSKKEEFKGVKNAINRIVNPFSNFFEKDFSERVKDMRNSFEHPENSSLEFKAGNFKELCKLEIKLEILQLIELNCIC